MKKLISITLTIIMILSVFAVIPTANAKTVGYKSKNCIYTIDSKGNATIIGSYNWEVNYLKIPKTLNGHKVTKIDWQYSYVDANKIKIPKTVKSISKSFYNAINRSFIDDYRIIRIVCYNNSYAHKYAKKYKVNYIISGENKTRGDIGDLTHFGYKVLDGKGKLYDFENTSKIYTGYEVKNSFTIKKNNHTLKKGKDYTVKYYNNYTIGNAFAVATGKGDYWGNIVLSYKIIPTQAEFLHVKKVSDTSVEYFIKPKRDMEQQVLEYSTDKDFKTKTTVYTDSFCEYNIEDLERNKTYYFRVRNYATSGNSFIINISENGKPYFCQGQNINFYGKWSEVKSITL
ncbi:MAG: hypothetical protein ACI4HL_00170 [Ruminococcus sp.]